MNPDGMTPEFLEMAFPPIREIEAEIKRLDRKLNPYGCFEGALPWLLQGYQQAVTRRTLAEAAACGEEEA